MKLKHVQYTHRSLAFLNALVTVAAGLDSASKLVCFCTKVGVARVQKKKKKKKKKSGRDQNFRGLLESSTHRP